MRALLVIALFLAAGAGFLFVRNVRTYSASDKFNKKELKHQFVVVRAHELLGFNLVDPEQAPLQIRDSVMRGYRLVLYTDHYAARYVGNQLSCVNCHFFGGDSLGGKNGGISLVGVTAVYPQYSKRAGRKIDLEERIENCFMRSMNGHPPPRGSRMMKDIINYLSWISKEVETLKEVPWLGLPSIKSGHKPDPKRGKELYIEHCAACHQLDGEGGGDLGKIEGKTIPPLWGPNSFNDGAGMNTLRMLAPFIFMNMPYKQATLTEEQALDIASYVIEQPRPHFEPKSSKKGKS